jgi:large subunit ribosomal protein L1
MDDGQLVENASAIVAAIEKKLPQGDKNIRNTMVKFSMGKAAKLTALKEAAKEKKGD